MLLCRIQQPVTRRVRAEPDLMVALAQPGVEDPDPGRQPDPVALLHALASIRLSDFASLAPRSGDHDAPIRQGLKQIFDWQPPEDVYLPDFPGPEISIAPSSDNVEMSVEDIFSQSRKTL